MPLSVPEKKPPQPSSNEMFAEKWLLVAKTEHSDVATRGATIAVAHALLAINDTLKSIDQELKWRNT